MTSGISHQVSIGVKTEITQDDRRRRITAVSNGQTRALALTAKCARALCRLVTFAYLSHKIKKPVSPHPSGGKQGSGWVVWGGYSWVGSLEWGRRGEWAEGLRECVPCMENGEREG